MLIRRDEGRTNGTRASHVPSTPCVVSEIEWHRVEAWLASGARDMIACRGRSLLFGACYVAMGHQIALAHERDSSWLTGFSAGFLFLGPLLAVGTYELSRQRERAEPADLVVSVFAWCRNPRALCLYAMLLCLVLTLWLCVSWTLSNQPVRSAIDADTVVAVSAVTFWWIAWSAFSLLAFVSSVVAIPMLLDRPVGVARAVRTSVACCIANAKAMSLWALVVASSIGASLWLDFWPLLLTGPWIGHATWHVYRDCVGSIRHAGPAMAHDPEGRAS